jgi:hypothetical protein
MSQHPDHAPSTAEQDIQGALVIRLVDKLVPLFRGPRVDRLQAGNMAILAMDAYNPESCADFVSAARTIAFSMAALTVLGTAAADDLAMPQKLRIYGRAVALNRSADQAERTMMQRRRHLNAAPSADQGGQAAGRPTKAELAAIEAAVALANAATNPEAMAEPAPATSAPTSLNPEAAMPAPPPFQVQARQPAQSAIHHPAPTGSRLASFKDALLANSAMQPIPPEIALRLRA